MIYDVVIGKTLPTKYNYNYIKSIYSNRISVEEITEYSDLVDLICTALNEAFENQEKLNSIVDNIIHEFTLLQSQLHNGDASIPEVKIREYLSTLAYVGYDMYIIRRPDLNDMVDLSDDARAYMIDKHDAYFPALNRVVTGTSLVFKNTFDADISTVVTQFLKDIKFTSVVDDALDLEEFMNKYEALESAHMGYSLDSDAIVQFLDDYGYKFVVVV